MVYSAADLLKLQANIKRDPDGYRDEFLLQYRHYQACLQLFQLKPSQDSKEFSECITFIAQVSKCYPTSTASFAPDVMALLEGQQALLDPQLRRAMVQALILLRNRNQLDPAVLLPLLFKLFRVNDKQLRELLFRHIISDLKAANQKGRNERLNKTVQTFLYSVLADDNELAAKKSLAVLSELWRRNIWRDARTVNCIASAVFHKSPAVLAAALKFFLGQDAAAVDDDESEDEGGEDGDSKGKSVVVAPTKEEVYKATHKGTKSSKKKKQAKLKRVMATLKKHARKQAAQGNEGFAALHLLHDPQGFAERLFGRLQGSRERWETRLDMMTVTSRAVGVHKLLLLNFYPFLQKYIAPHQRDVTAVLAALVQAVHELVPPESLAPVLRQLVDQFVHDRARPEVMTIGLKAVRELSLRCPLVMTEELLQDLAEYKRFRDKEVATAARSLIGAFRELNPALLAKKDRGRGADIASGPTGYGVSAVAERLEGAELLEAHLAKGGTSSDSDGWEGGSGSESEEEEDGGTSGDGEDGREEGEGVKGEEGSEDGVDVDSEDEEQQSGSEAEGLAEGEEDREAGADDGSSGDSGAEDGSSSKAEGEQEAAAAADRQGQPSTSGRDSSSNKQQQQRAGSLASLKKQLAAANAAKQQQQQDDAGGGIDAAAGVPIEMTRILTEDDFRRIRELKRHALIKAALSRHGLASGATEAKKRRMLVAAEAEADEALALAAKKAKITEAQVAPDDLTGRHKKRKDKAERLASVMAGREGREAFGARAKVKKQKQAGLSEREKQRKKAMPIAARIQQLKNRSTKSRNKSNPRHFKGHVKSK